jgi:hypothetical protein
MRGGDNTNEDPNTPEMLVARLLKEEAREVDDEARAMDGELMTGGGRWESAGAGGGVTLSGGGRGGAGMGDGGGMRRDTVSTGASLALGSVPESHIKTETHIKTSGGASSTRAGSSGVKSSQLKEVLDVLRVHLQSASDNDLDLDPETFKMFKSEFVTLCERTRKSRTK